MNGIERFLAGCAVFSVALTCVLIGMDLMYSATFSVTQVALLGFALLFLLVFSVIVLIWFDEENKE